MKKQKQDTTPSVWNPNFKYQPAGTAMDLAAKFKRIQDMINGVIKPVQQPAKEYQMPKSGDTVTVAKMKEQIAKKKAKKK